MRKNRKKSPRQSRRQRQRELLSLAAATALLYAAPAMAVPDANQLPMNPTVHFGLDINDIATTVTDGNYNMTITTGEYSFISWDSYSIGSDASVVYQMSGGG